MSADPFFARMQACLNSGTFVKCTLSKPQAAAGDLRNVFLRPVLIQGRAAVQWTFRHATRDVVKNQDASETLSGLREMLGQSFTNADLFCTDGNVLLKHNRRGEPTVIFQNAARQSAPDLRHDREKQRLIDPHSPWLHALGITSARGEVLPTSQAKWRQMNKFLEIIENLVAGAEGTRLPAEAQIADMGSGKGYLTFALHEFLTQRRGMTPWLTGIELRPELVQFCQSVAEAQGWPRLQFRAGSIETCTPERLDMLIALHACDTATDLALAAGVRLGASVIIAAPCCHKQVRRDLGTHGDLGPILKHGILEERQAELLTDGLRALLLEAEGYRTRVFEFISTEHTAKNLMITAVRQARTDERKIRQAREEVERIKDAFGLQRHFLEEALARPQGIPLLSG